MNVLTIGAGIAGLTAARRLQENGHTVTVLDKGRAPGGHMATRRVLNGDADRPELAELAFDHGAQYFTARDARFAHEVEGWHKARVAQLWHGKLAAFDSEGREPVDDGHARWVGVPGMSAIARHLARGLDVLCNRRVTGLERDAASGAVAWHASLADQRTLGPFDAVVVALPAPQALPLVAASPSLSRAVGAVRMHPCWAVMVAFDDRVATPFDAAFVTSSPLGWVARDRSKPQRGLAETWVLQASADWAAAHVDDDADVVGPFLLNAFADLVRARLPLPVHLAAHRWRYACGHPPAHHGALVDVDLRMAACGDWCAGNRVEGAFLSGVAAADALLAQREVRSQK
ncbi:MAG: FAD-dependent oxidoreductase [Acidobacteria bacterium]|nr:FAD-dependent oxidoreductase [Acidobacteriota bacterium]